MDRQQRYLLVGMIIATIVLIILVISIINYQKKSEFEYMHPIDIDSLEQEDRDKLADYVEMGNSRLVQVGGRYFIVLTTGGPTEATIQYEVNTYNRQVENSDEMEPYIKVTWWLGEPDGRRTVKYVILEVKHKAFEVAYRESLTVPVTETIVSAVVTKLDDETLKVWCEEYGTLQAITQESLPEGTYIQDIQEGVYSLKIQMVDDKLKVNEIIPENSIIISGTLDNSLGVYDTIKLTKGGTLQVKNRKYKLEGEVRLVIDSNFEVINKLN